MQTIFPKIFGYEKAGILFKDDNTQTLYTINCEDYSQIKLFEDNIVRYPMNMGLSGKAVQKKKVLITHSGEKDANFASEIDNFLSIYKIQNMLIAPFTDRNGNVRGIIQLINKNGRMKIPESDELEIQALLPALGEIVKTADEALQIINISAGVKIYL